MINIKFSEQSAMTKVNLYDFVVFLTGQRNSIMEGMVSGITERGLHVRLLSPGAGTIFVKWCNVKEIKKRG
jgi:hypothetical protein